MKTSILFEFVNNHKRCAICKATFICYEQAETADERTLCEDCRTATSKLNERG